jgi:hypothetical protein
MAVALAYALRRTSARIVLVLAIGALAWAVYRTMRPAGPTLGLSLEGYYPFVPPPATSWDLAAAALGLVVALVVAAALWWERPARR